MFRRHWSGLPVDPVFPADLSELGYFINEYDEIRSLEDSDYYFKYFLTKNERYNDRRRFAFDEAISKIVHSRLDAEALTPLRLPLGTQPTDRHVPIRISHDLPKHSRVVLIIGEDAQQFGVLAHRVLGGKGGVTKGSVLNLVQGLKKQPSSAADPTPPGIIIANPGELWWWPEGKRGLTAVHRHDIPMASAVHYGRAHDQTKNGVPKNLNVGQHIKCVFEEVVDKLVSKDAKLDVIAVGNSAEEVERFLNDDEVWAKFGGRMGALVVLGGFYHSDEFKCEGFKQFMEKRARAYTIHHTPLDNAVAGSMGNPAAVGFTSFGCPTYSAGEAGIVEMLLIETHDSVLNWLKTVALEGGEYQNEDIQIFGDHDETAPEEMLSAWAENGIGKQDSEEFEAEVESDKADDEGTPTKEATVGNESSPDFPLVNKLLLEQQSKKQDTMPRQEQDTVAAAEKDDEESVVLKVKNMKVTVEDEE
ncbi:Arb2 domain-containing protein [Triangularia verruculosa]|uniref:Arb2 domain-containing protein n=1 Tax=Triangularia verruculosa TaxID=2587418 RepID=A0AAN6X8P3_9PEZI|nr:Arb2 domain-containing protein [Triangularia verruculosa]